jgi:hypothetical protein
MVIAQIVSIIWIWISGVVSRRKHLGKTVAKGSRDMRWNATQSWKKWARCKMVAERYRAGFVELEVTESSMDRMNE